MKELNKLKAGNMSYCCYHEDEESFRSALSEVRKLLSIPQTLSKVCAMAVCSCRKSERLRRSPLAQLQLLEYQGEFPPDSVLLDKIESTIGHNSKQFVLDVLDKKRKGMESAFRLVMVFKMALNSDYTLLNEEQSQRIRRIPSPGVTKQVNHHVLVRCVLARRKKQAECSFSKFFYLNDGKKIFKFHTTLTDLLWGVSCQFKPCVLETAKQKLSRFSETHINAVPITIWCQKKTMNSLIEKLEEKFAALEGSRPFRSYRRRTIFLCTDYRSSDIEDKRFLNDLLLNVKQTKSYDYGKKAHHANNDSHGKSAPGVRSSIKCYNCQQNQLTLPPQKRNKRRHHKNGNTIAEPSPSEDCQHHPGFVAKGKWSCCGRVSDTHLSLTEQHSTDGCVKSVSHKWLYQNKSCVKSTGIKDRFIQDYPLLTANR